MDLVGGEVKGNCLLHQYDSVVFDFFFFFYTSMTPLKILVLKKIRKTHKETGNSLETFVKGAPVKIRGNTVKAVGAGALSLNCLADGLMSSQKVNSRKKKEKKNLEREAGINENGFQTKLNVYNICKQ